jgi:hypothetical protein
MWLKLNSLYVCIYKSYLCLIKVKKEWMTYIQLRLEGCNEINIKIKGKERIVPNMLEFFNLNTHTCT